MIYEFLRSLEDGDKPLLAPNVWLLEICGMLLPKNKVKKTIWIIIHEIATYFVLSQYIELYVIRSDLDLVLTNLKISMLSAVCVLKANTFVFWQKKWREVIAYVTKADKEERGDADETKGKILDTYTKYCRKVTYNYWILVFMTFISVTQTPVIKYASSETYREQLRNGTEPFPHIYSSWMPFDKNHSPGNWLTVLWHILISIYGSVTMAAYDANAVTIMVFFGGKLELLRERCREMTGDSTAMASEEDVDKNIKKLHSIHVELMKYSREFNRLLSPVMFFYIIMCSLMLCASAFQLTSATTATQKMFMAEFLMFGILQLFIFCWHSNDVLIKFENVMRGPYESKWWLASTRTQRSVLTLTAQLRNTHTFTAGPFTPLTLSTFITILKGAYSYYTLLRK